MFLHACLNSVLLGHLTGRVPSNFFQHKRTTSFTQQENWGRLIPSAPQPVGADLFFHLSPTATQQNGSNHICATSIDRANTRGLLLLTTHTSHIITASTLHDSFVYACSVLKILDFFEVAEKRRVNRCSPTRNHSSRFSWIVLELCPRQGGLCKWTVPTWRGSDACRITLAPRVPDIVDDVCR